MRSLSSNRQEKKGQKRLDPRIDEVRVCKVAKLPSKHDLKHWPIFACHFFRQLLFLVRWQPPNPLKLAFPLGNGVLRSQEREGFRKEGDPQKVLSRGHQKMFRYLCGAFAHHFCSWFFRDPRLPKKQRLCLFRGPHFGGKLYACSAWKSLLIKNLLTHLFLMGCFLGDFQEGERPIKAFGATAHWPIKEWKRPINADGQFSA